MFDVRAAQYAMNTSLAEVWLYSVSAWCSETQTYFQLLAVRAHDVVDLVQEHLVLLGPIERGRPRQVPLDEDAELHLPALCAFGAGPLGPRLARSARQAIRTMVARLGPTPSTAG